MFFKNRIFSRWWGPVVGGGVGIEFALEHANIKRPEEFLPNLAVFGGLGFAAGMLVLFLDPPLRKEAGSLKQRGWNPSRPSLGGNMLCALSLIFFFMPFFSIVLAGLALMLNWKVGGWPKFLSLLALQIGMVMTYLIVRAWMYQSTVGH